MSKRFHRFDEFEVNDLASICMSADLCPVGLLWGYECDGNIADTYNAGDEDIIGCIDAPDWIPAGGWEFVDNALMTGAFAQVVRRES